MRFEAHEMVHPNGRAGEHGVVITPRASAVVVLDGENVVFTRQSRFAIDRIVLEVVKGGAAPGESALDAARRETREELGLVAERWDDLGIVYEIPSIVQESVALFLARDVAPAAQHLEDVESIDVVRMRLRDALAAAESGELADAVSAVALLRAARRIAAEAV